MPRPRREDFPGAWHHVMNRGAGRGSIFTSEADRSLFLNCLTEASEQTDLEVHGYCLLGNHYHLLLLSRAGRLSDGMKHLAGKFTRLFNLRHNRDGPLFRSRFASVPIRTDAHLVQVSRYIHLNPVVAKLAEEPEDWPWSSAAAYLGHSCGPRWLRTTTILAMFGAPIGVPRTRPFSALASMPRRLNSMPGWNEGVRPGGSDTLERVIDSVLAVFVLKHRGQTLAATLRPPPRTARCARCPAPA